MEDLKIFYFTCINIIVKNRVNWLKYLGLKDSLKGTYIK